ncbi:MAG TPA: disulfide oxidoreductase [Firmicutes bacterium]|nr:disulfide oxidoreductase [Bacillota bacterium]
MVITKDMSIIEVVQLYPATIEIFRKYGMGCFGCAAARFENIEQGAAAHGIDIDALVADLNKAVHAAKNG